MFCPAMVTVPLRGVVLVFGANAAVTGPAVVPLVGETAIQVGSLTVAVHEAPVHPAGVAVTVNVVEPPLAEIMGTEVGDTEKVHERDVTVRLAALEVRVPCDAVMVVDPAPTPVASPVLAPMVATPELDEFQVTLLVMAAVLESL
jgi:hypothetical protein